MAESSELVNMMAKLMQTMSDRDRERDEREDARDRKRDEEVASLRAELATASGGQQKPPETASTGKAPTIKLTKFNPDEMTFESFMNLTTTQACQYPPANQGLAVASETLIDKPTLLSTVMNAVGKEITNGTMIKKDVLYKEYNLITQHEEIPTGLAKVFSTIRSEGYGAQHDKSYYRDEFNNMHRKPEETFDSFFARWNQARIRVSTHAGYNVDDDILISDLLKACRLSPNMENTMNVHSARYKSLDEFQKDAHMMLKSIHKEDSALALVADTPQPLCTHDVPAPTTSSLLGAVSAEAQYVLNMYTKGRLTDVVCFRCHEKGHIARDCMAPAPKGGNPPGIRRRQSRPRGQRTRNAEVSLPQPQPIALTTDAGAHTTDDDDTTPASIEELLDALNEAADREASERHF